MPVETRKRRPHPDLVRLADLPREYPLFGIASYRKAIDDGRLPAMKHGTARNGPVIVRRQDVERFLTGEMPESAAG